MKKYTLTYFDVRGRAEPIRLVLAFAGVDYDDKGLSRDEWLAFKPDAPLGQIPVLTEHRPEGDRRLVQSMSIIRYLARTHGLEGKTDDERLAADIAAETAVDLRTAWGTFRFSPAFEDEAGKAKYLNETAPVHFARLERLLGDRNWFAGSSPTYADLYVFDALDRHLVVWPGALEKFPKLAAFDKRVRALPELSKYLSTRRAA